MPATPMRHATYRGPGGRLWHVGPAWPAEPPGTCENSPACGACDAGGTHGAIGTCDACGDWLSYVA
eukprot:4884205-Pyramimonas_sp.AAC.1